MSDGSSINTEKTNEIIQKKLGSYVIGRILGKGQYGQIRRATHIPTNEKVAIRVIEKDQVEIAEEVENLKKQIDILKRVRHPHIVQLLEIIETRNVVFIVMEWISGGELFDYVIKTKKLMHSEATLFFQQLLSAIEYLHSIGIAHRDIKPDNILIDSHRNVKLIDFDLAAVYQPKQLLKTACGSPYYTAPEVLAGKKYVGYKSDLWSLGVVMYIMIEGKMPFNEKNQVKLYRKVLKGIYKPVQGPPDLHDLFKRILNPNPQLRYNLVQVKNHIWLKRYEVEIPPGINTKMDIIPVDAYIAYKLEEKFFINRDKTREQIQTNRHNANTVIYYLILQGYVQGRGSSDEEDSESERSFDTDILQPDESQESENSAASSLIRYDSTEGLFRVKTKRILTPSSKYTQTNTENSFSVLPSRSVTPNSRSLTPDSTMPIPVPKSKYSDIASRSATPSLSSRAFVKPLRLEPLSQTPSAIQGDISPHRNFFTRKKFFM